MSQPNMGCRIAQTLTRNDRAPAPLQPANVGIRNGAFELPMFDRYTLRSIAEGSFYLL
jgi:hypothetical protein